MVMHSTLSWADLAGRRVGIYGIGLEGRSSLKACRARGIAPVIVDDRPTVAVVDGVKVTATGDGGLDLLLGCDVVIKSPGISHYSNHLDQLHRNGVEIVSGLGMWMQGADRERVLCVGGTKGKSTTSALLAHLVRSAGLNCYLGGNIGDAPFDPDVSPEFDYWVIEVGSYQSVDFGVTSPHVAITSLGEDHLDWHRND
ncbi:MAG: Mur ligase family protein, partial [Candidatus Nanopelagicales bacterium]|nr:Mur ligase family protein [Candidatus Nanopelagicales bacterium]